MNKASGPENDEHDGTTSVHSLGVKGQTLSLYLIPNLICSDFRANPSSSFAFKVYRRFRLRINRGKGRGSFCVFM